MEQPFPLGLSTAPRNDFKETAEIIERKLQNDELYPTLEKLVSTQAYSQNYKPEKSKYQMSAIKPIPSIIINEFQDLKWKTSSGFFPEISRAWITIDNRIFLWDYSSTREGVDVYDQQDQVILAAAIVPPKDDIFVSEVTHLLVLATTIEVIILALTFEPNKRMIIHPTKYILPVGITVQKVVGTRTGRIFLASKDGILYEIDYSATDGWWNKKMKKMDRSSNYLQSFVPSVFSGVDALCDIVVDNSRNFLYTLSANSSIQVYQLGDNGDQMNKIIVYRTVVKDVGDKCPAFKTYTRESGVFDIIGLYVVNREDGGKIHLVAVTRTGLRLYFSLTGVVNSNLFQRQVALYLEHVRLPPFSGTRLAGSQEWTQIDTNYYSDDVFTFVSKQRGSFALKFLTPDVDVKHLMTTSLIETDWTSMMEVMPTSICEIPQLELLGYNPNLNYAEAQIQRNEFATQHINQPRQFVILSSSGVLQISKRRVIDDLSIILEQTGGESQQITEMVQNYGHTQLCAMCLAIAVNGGNTSVSEPGMSAYPINKKLIDAATYAFNHYGRGVSEHSYKQKFSAAHDGFALYLSRLLRPIWNYLIVWISRSPLYAEYDPFNSNLKEADLIRIKTSLERLESYITEIKFAPTIGPSVRLPLAALEIPYRQAQKASPNAESQSLSNLHIILNRSIEALALLITLLRCSFYERITSMFEPQYRPYQLVDLRFRVLVSEKDGENYAKELVNLLNSGSEEFEEVADTLRKRCPSFFSQDDRIRVKGVELLNRAEMITGEKRIQLLEESLYEFKKIAAHLNEQNYLEKICPKYQRMYYYTAILQLVLMCAEDVDPENRAIDWIKGGQNENDEIGKAAYENRQAIYKYFFIAFEELNSLPQFMDQLDPLLQPKEQLVQIMKITRNSQDEVFHITLYEWYMNNNLQEDILNYNTQYLESFLREYCKKYQRYDLLWRYLVNNRRFAEAARILSSTAFEEGLKSLEVRFENLARAVANAKSSNKTNNPISADELQSYEEKLEVAHLQIKVKNELNKLSDEEQKRNIQNLLDYKLYTVNELYEEFASKYALLESALALLAISGEHKPEVVEKLWESIIMDACQEEEFDYPNISSLSSKIIQLGKEYYPNDLIFPVGFLVNTLEKISLRAANEPGWNEFWIIDAMSQIKVSYYELFVEYIRIWESNGSDWKNDQIHLARVISEIISRWINSLLQPTTQMQERRIFKDSNVQKIIEQIGISVRSRYPTSEEEVLARLKHIDEMIKKYRL